MSTPYRRGEHERLKARVDLANEFISKYRARIVAALPKYGQFEAATDNRNMGTEIVEEVLDVGSYLEFGEEMRPDLTSFIQKMRAKAIHLYEMSKRLEEMMRTPAKEGDA